MATDAADPATPASPCFARRPVAQQDYQPRRPHAREAAGAKERDHVTQLVRQSGAWWSRWRACCHAAPRLMLAAQIHTEGGRYLGRALRQNDSLVDLNLRLNRLADEARTRAGARAAACHCPLTHCTRLALWCTQGGAMLMEGLRSNGTLTTLNLGRCEPSRRARVPAALTAHCPLPCSNSLSSLACAGLCRLMRGEECVLEVMDLSGNELSEDDGTLLVEALSTNQRLVALDLRMNKVCAAWPIVAGCGLPLLTLLPRLPSRSPWTASACAACATLCGATSCARGTTTRTEEASRAQRAWAKCRSARLAAVRVHACTCTRTHTSMGMQRATRALTGPAGA